MHEIISDICRWLLCCKCAFVLSHAQELADNHVRIVIDQIKPEQRQRVFDVVPAEMADCWNVLEAE